MNTDKKLYDEIDSILLNKENTENVYNWAILDESDMRNFDNLVPKEERPIQYDFSLDDFQKRAFLQLYNGNHVFVSAHTSAGKTITAEWAIALALSKGRKAIYTSPIKALSNQKFRDFRVKFNDIEVEEVYSNSDMYYDDDIDEYGYSNSIYDFDSYKDVSEDKVGIITGDIQLNKEAPCLILTTEILRTMIYDNDPILQELDCVVFDEIHYMNDPERGRVWEEVITLLPDHVVMLFLSATTPNSMEFSEWVGRERNKNVYVVSTTKRPIPLEHYIHIGTHDVDLVKYYKNDEELKTEYLDKLDPKQVNISEEIEKIEKMKFTKTKLKDEIPLELEKSDGMYLLVDKDNNFNELYQKEVRDIINEKSTNNFKSALSFNQAKHHWLSIFKLLEIKQKFPVVVFVFSKKMCITLTEHLSNNDYTYKREKSHIKVFIDKCLSRLKPDDRTLPQILTTTELLMRGIAIHHGGLLPILKEMTEILFQRGFIRILFATETFAMGINMPTRCVIFNSISKHDGQHFRNLLPGEYTQMSGRAGRRGLDDVGTVIVTHWKPNNTNYKKLISGKPLMLSSRFRLTYQTILSILGQNNMEKDITGLLRSSFSEFGNNRDEYQIGKINRVVKKSKVELSEMKLTLDNNGFTIWKSVSKIGKLISDALNYIYQPKLFKLFFYVNRKILVWPETCIYPYPMTITEIADTHLMAKSFSVEKDSENLPIKIKYEWILAFCDNFKVYNEVYNNRIYDIKYLKFKQSNLPFELSSKLLEINELLVDIYKLPAKKYNQVEAKSIRECLWLESKILELESKSSDSALTLFPDYNGKIKLLKDFNFIDSDELLNLKGRIATRINTCHELVLTEFIMEAGLQDMNVPQCAALLSCLISNEVKSDSLKYNFVKEFDVYLYAKLEKLDKIVNNMLEKHKKYNIDVDPDKFKIENFNPSLTKLVYYWASGETFADIMKYTEVMEGTIVRGIMRLDELCQEIARSSSVMGDDSIKDKMLEVSIALRRDIVFCGSLYI